MNNEELKKKIADIVLGVEWTGCLGNPYHISGGMSVANAIADALIEAGLNFGKVVSHTATFDLAQLERINRLEIQAAETEHRAEVAERAIDLILTREKDLRCIHSFTNCDKNCELCWEGYFSKQKQGYLEQAEKELAEERKDD